MHVPPTPSCFCDDISTLYDIGSAKLMGKGGISNVYSARHIPTGEFHALKVIQRSTLVGKKAETVTHEKEILRRTCHPNVITLHGVYQTPEQIFLALELMDGDLFDFIHHNGKINEALTRHIMHSVLSGINYLHEQSIVHRDIKPENIVINVRYFPTSEEDVQRAKSGCPLNVNNVNPRDVQVLVKLADLGLAKLVVEWDVRSTPCGTAFYIAPEIIRGIEEQGARPICTTRQLVKSVDVWSAGVVFYVLLFGRPPFYGHVTTGTQRRALLEKISQGLLSGDDSWDAVSGEARDLLQRMLDQTSSSRITSADALRHAFFTANGYPHPVPGGVTAHPKLSASPRATELGGVGQTHPSGKGAPAVGNATAEDIKKSGVIASVRSLFGGGAKKDAATLREEQKLHDELAALQRNIIMEDDQGGEVLPYKPCMPILESKSTRTALMNPNARVGPAALKK